MRINGGKGEGGRGERRAKRKLIFIIQGIEKVKPLQNKLVFVLKKIFSEISDFETAIDYFK